MNCAVNSPRPLLDEGNTRLSRDVAQLFDDRQDKRNAISSADRLGLTFGIAGHERAVRSRRRSRLSQGTHVLVDLPLELARLDERVDPQGAEEMAGPLADRAGRDFLAKRERRHERPPDRAGEDRREHIDHHYERVALVAAALTGVA